MEETTAIIAASTVRDSTATAIIAASTVRDSTATAIDSIASGGEIKEDDEHDAKEAVLLRYFLQEWELVKSLLDQIVGSRGISDPSDVRKIRSIIDKYQEQGQLLEPYLESIVSPLMHIVRSKTMQLGVANDEVLEIIKPLCIVIYTLVTVCGYKSVVKFFPHQVSDLELAVSLLEKCHRTAPMSSSRQESTGEMETKCIILLWLYILVLIPFDLSSVDTSIADGKYMDGSEPSPLVIKILEISKDYLSSAGPMRKISGLLLSKLLTRPDMLKSFDSFTKWAHEVLLSDKDDVVNHFRFLGVVEALASIFKVGSRKIFLNVLSTTWCDCSLLMNSSTAARSPLLRKLVIKLSQYIGLNCLPQRSPSWRYLGKNGILLENISLKATEEGKLINHAQLGDNQNCMQHGPCLEEDMYVPEIVEEIIELLLTGLRDSDTVVRWCAAKGVGRITSRLTSSFSEDVLSSLLELFSPGEGDGSWHGGCLAIAELARRGLLLPVNFPKVVPFIIKALHYDIRRGPHSIGSHVRDAAAYVCWAFGRAYSNSDMKGILEQLAPHLLTVSCYDREVNCRRAASAAFQENVGRQGTFPHGIDIVNTADYFSLSSRANSYLHVAVSIAQYKEYLYPFVEELICYKISHWDKSLREMAAVSLSALAKYDHDFFAIYVLDKLIPCTLSLDLCMRHGATLAIGELVLSLHQRGFIFPHEKQKSISCIVPAIEKARLYRGKGGEIMRSSVSRFIECISLSGIFLTEKTKLGLLSTLSENLKHPNTQIQRTAIDALGKFVEAYLIVADVDDKVANDIASKYIQLLDDPNVAGRRGAALALGILPYGFLSVRWKAVIKKLCSCCTSQDNPDDLDAEARVNAVCGLVSVCETLSKASINQNSEDVRSMYFFIKTDVVQTLFTALNDYSVDNRGDVGSWVREAAMHGLERCTYILCERDSVISMKKPGFEHPLEAPYGVDSTDPSFLLFDAKIATDLIGGLAKQAVEKIDKIREIAAKTLQKILYNQKYFISFIPHRNILEDIIPRDPDVNWAVPTFSYPRMVQLLQCNCYSKSILSGLVLSVGGLQESLRRVAVSALLDYIQAAEGDLDEKINTKKYILSNDLLWILQQYQKCDRVITPTLKTIEILLSSKVFLQMEVFGSGILDSLAVELKGSKDFTKLCTGLSVLGYVASLVESLSPRALSQLLSFLGHRYPKIRKAAADQVYLVLLQNESLIAEEKLERALEVVAETCWEASMEEAKSGRLRLYEMVSGKESSASFRVSNPETSKRSERITKTDENASYSSLVDFRGF